MNDNTMTSNHNEKKETNVQVAQIVELGNVTQLTLGGQGYRYEYMRPNTHSQMP